jgi:hypothetical protein
MRNQSRKAKEMRGGKSKIREFRRVGEKKSRK